jgi:hypothetical protein
MAITLLVAIALPFLLPANISTVTRWIVPAIEALLLIALLVADPGRIDRHTTFVRVISIALVAVLVAGAAIVTVRLAIVLVDGGKDTNSAAELLRVGGLVWLYVIISFAFLYWELDSGGPVVRRFTPHSFPDLAFPQEVNPHIVPAGWRPQFFDYLYLGFTNSTAFSPTDVMPLALWAKFAMTVQATSSLVILGLVIARAVNILK